MKSLSLIALWLAMSSLGLDADDKPKSMPLTEQQRIQLDALNSKAGALQQELRAIQAERQLLQLQANAMLDKACEGAKAKACHIDGQNLVIDKK